MTRSRLLFSLIIIALIISACAPATFIPSKGIVTGTLENKTVIYGTNLISVLLKVTYTELPHLYPAGQEDLIYTYDITIDQYRLKQEVTFYCDNYAWGYVKCDVKK